MASRPSRKNNAPARQKGSIRRRRIKTTRKIRRDAGAIRTQQSQSRQSELVKRRSNYAVNKSANQEQRLRSFNRSSIERVIDVGRDFEDSDDERSIENERFINLGRDYDELDESVAKKLADLTKLVHQEQDYAAPNADLGAIWMQKTPSYLYRRRGENQPIIKIIDSLLDDYKTNRDQNNYQNVQKILTHLDAVLRRWLEGEEGYDGKHRDAALKLHNAVKLKRHREKLGLQLMHNYAIKSDKNVEKFAGDPYRTYNEISATKRDHQKTNPGDRNFQFSMIAPTLENMQNHIRDIRQRLLFGGDNSEQQDGGRVQIHANVSDRLKKELSLPSEGLGNKTLLDKLNEDIEALKGDGYRYKDTIELIVKFMKVIDYITFRAKTEIEINRALEGTEKSSADIRPTKGFRDQFREQLDRRRQENFGNDDSVKSSFPFYWHEVTAEDIYKGNYTLGRDLEHPTVSDDAGIYLFEKLPGGSDPKELNRIQWLIDNPDIILFPSYEELTPKFFGQIRSVPIYMVGMLNTEFLNADNILQSPAAFFSHDLYHIIGFSNKESPQQLLTLNERVQYWTEQTKGITKEDVYFFWSNNWRKLEQRIEQLKENFLKDAIYDVLFMALHEPTDRLKYRIPTVLEKEPLINRISENWNDPRNNKPGSFITVLRDRIEQGEFGEVDNAVVEQLETAKDWLVKNLPTIFATKPEIKNFELL